MKRNTRIAADLHCALVGSIRSVQQRTLQKLIRGSLTRAERAALARQTRRLAGMLR